MNTLVADPGIASQILAEHRAGLADAQSAIHHARRAGELLLEARERCARGEWLPWLEAHCPQIPERTASRYMQIARSPQLEAESVREAILKLASPRKSNNSPRVAGSSKQPSAAGDKPSLVNSAPCGPVVDAGNGLPPEWTEDYAPSAEEIAELNQMIAAGEAPESDQEPAGFYFGGIVPKVLPEGERLQQLVTALEQRRDEAMTLAHNRLDLLKRKTSQCEELETQVKHWRGRAKELEACEQENEQLRQRITELEGDNERLRERIAIMEEARC